MTSKWTAERISAAIDSTGWHCVSVAAGAEQEVEFSYSVGFIETLDHPEIAIFGLPSRVAAQILSNAFDRIRAEGPLKAGELRDGLIGNGYLLKVAGPADRQLLPEYFGIAFDRYGLSLSVMILLWPNKAGVFPDEVEGPNPQSEAVALVSSGRASQAP